MGDLEKAENDLKPCQREPENSPPDADHSPVNYLWKLLDHKSRHPGKQVQVDSNVAAVKRMLSETRLADVARG